MDNSAATQMENGPHQDPLQRLAALMPEGTVVTDATELKVQCQDIYSQGPIAQALIRPTTCEDVATAIGVVGKAGLAIVPKGGGMSYTGGFLPATTSSVLLDLSRLDRIVELNLDDMYVVVEAGCTWLSLHSTLAAHGVRTPYWGPLSGIKSTVGGALSQNSVFFGSTLYGTAADTVLGLAVVLPDGSTLRTGSWSHNAGTPFLRYNGPDMTGIFLGDAGAMGVKVMASLKLIPVPDEVRCLSFAFTEPLGLARAMSQIARQTLATECFSFDPFLQRQRTRRESLSKDLKALTDVVTSAKSLAAGIAEGARMAVKGRRFLEDNAYSLHVVVEDLCAAGANHRVDRITKICGGFGGRAIDNVIPRVVRACPFNPITGIIGPEGERWVPVHGVFPHSKVPDLLQQIDRLVESMQVELTECGIGIGYLTTAVGTTATLVEPVFFWPDSLMDVHHRTLPAETNKRLKAFPENLTARARVQTLRTAFVDLFQSNGCIHFQIGKTYPIRREMQSEAKCLMSSIKMVIDPGRIMNPGALGL